MNSLLLTLEVQLKTTSVNEVKSKMRLPSNWAKISEEYLVQSYYCQRLIGLPIDVSFRSFRTPNYPRFALHFLGSFPKNRVQFNIYRYVAVLPDSR